MNLVAYGSMFLLALFGFIWNVNSKRQSKIYAALIVTLFIVAVISRKTGFFIYSDLGHYIWRFVNNDNAYFSNAYSYLTKAISMLFGTNVNAFLGVIAFVIAGLSLVSIFVWNESAYKINKKFCFEPGPTYVNTFLLIFLAYWGVAFSAEVIRTGIAISLSMVSLAFARKKSIVPCVVFAFLSVAFHWTEIFFLPIIFLLFFAKDCKYNKVNTTKMYFWLAFIIFLDFVDIGSLLAKYLNSVLNLILQGSSQYDHYLVYITYRQRPSLFSYISIQYVYYRLLAFLLTYVYNNSKTNNNSILLYSYYIGLTVFTVMSGFGTVTRMQWIFVVPSVFLLYDYVKSENVIKFDKIFLVTTISILQAIMAISYLGYHF